MSRREDAFMDKHGHWRSHVWRRFVRSLRCCCGDSRCPTCGPLRVPDRVVAAHLRNRAGMSVNPDDFLCYPLTDTIHRIYHNKGQPSVARQLEFVTETLRLGFQRGVLLIDEDPEGLVDF